MISFHRLVKICPTANQCNLSFDLKLAFSSKGEMPSAVQSLTYFYLKKETTLLVDASMKGAALIKDDQPVAFPSKSLADGEERCASIERELVAVSYGYQKLHTYLYEQSFTVLTDHKPLESIHMKHITAAPPHLQWMLLRMQANDLTIH